MKLFVLPLFAASVCLAQPGALDFSFNCGSGAIPTNNGIPSGAVTALCLQTNGQILVGGSFVNFNNITRRYVARLNTDGSLDVSFNIGSGPNGNVNYIAIGTNGLVWVGGSFSQVNGNYQTGVARLRSDGSQDVSFTNSIVGQVRALASDQNGNGFFGGDFTAVNGWPESHIAKFSAVGNLDLTFSASTFTNDGVNSDGSLTSVTAIAVQTNGCVIVAGDFTAIGNQPCQLIARLNPNGQMDTTFVGPGLIGGTAPTITSVIIQSNGQIVIAGDFLSVNGYSELGVARLNPDGTLDTTFHSQSGFSAPSTIAVQSNGKIISVGGGPFPVRLNVDGSLDSTFSGSMSGLVYAMAVQSDGKILIGGGFNVVDGTNANTVARLTGDSSNQAQVQLLSPALYLGVWLSGNVGSQYAVQFATNLSTPVSWMPLTTLILTNNPSLIVDPSAPGTSRFYRAVSMP